MSYTPETKWDNIVKSWTGKDEEYYGSVIYQNVPYSGTGRLEIGTIGEFDCSDYNYHDHVGEVNAYKKTIFTFENDVKIEVRLWTDSDSEDVALWCKVIGVYNNTDQVNAGYYLSIFQGRSGGYDHFCNPIMLRTYGFKLLFISDYFDANSSPTYGITPMISFICRLYFPSCDKPGQDRFFINDLSQIVDGATLSYLREDPDVPLPFIGDQIGPFFADYAIITDEAAYLTALKTIGGNMTDPAGYGSKDTPNQDGNPSGTGGGGGSYNPTGSPAGGYTKDSQPVDFPALPSGGALDTGSIKAFVVNTGTITAMFQELWSTSLTDLTNWQKLFTQPLDALISLNCLPFVPSASGSAAIHLGNIDFNDMITGTPLTSQYKTLDCGKYTLKPFWGSALDTSPYTKVEIYVPFVGIREIKPEDCVGLEMHLKYNVDVLTGNLTAQLKCGMSVLYKWQGNCKATVPVSSVVNSALESLVKSAGGIAAASSGNAAGAAISAAVNVALAKPAIQRSGDISGSTGLLDEFLPYLIIHRPIQSLAKDFKKFKGYPSNITATLSSLKGYTEVEEINLSVPGATDQELNEIKQLLSEGVLL